MIIEKKLSELIVGHYVVQIKKQKHKLTLGNPSHIKSISVINNLRYKGVESVLIDDEKTLVIDLERGSEVVNNISSQLSSNEITSANLKVTRQLFNKSKIIQKKVLNDVKNGTDINLEPVSEITHKSVEAIFDNPDSLACLVNIRHKNEYLLEHSLSVSIYLSIFANYLDIDKETTHQMSIGAFLHDVGKIMVPDKILNKPGKLTDSEFYIMKTHANHSVDILEKNKWCKQVVF